MTNFRNFRSIDINVFADGRTKENNQCFSFMFVGIKTRSIDKLSGKLPLVITLLPYINVINVEKYWPRYNIYIKLF